MQYWLERERNRIVDAFRDWKIAKWSAWEGLCNPIGISAHHPLLEYVLNANWIPLQKQDNHWRLPLDQLRWRLVRPLRQSWKAECRIELDWTCVVVCLLAIVGTNSCCCCWYCSCCCCLACCRLEQDVLSNLFRRSKRGHHCVVGQLGWPAWRLVICFQDSTFVASSKDGLISCLVFFSLCWQKALSLKENCRTICGQTVSWFKGICTAVVTSI